MVGGGGMRRCLSKGRFRLLLEKSRVKQQHVPAYSEPSSTTCCRIIATSSSTAYAVSASMRKTTVSRVGCASSLCSGNMAAYFSAAAELI